MSARRTALGAAALPLRRATAPRARRRRRGRRRGRRRHRAARRQPRRLVGRPRTRRSSWASSASAGSSPAVPVTVTVTDRRGPRAPTRWPRARSGSSDVTDVGAGDHVDGFGYGWGLRWEGRGKWAYRVGGPMATRRAPSRPPRRLASQDPHEFVEAVVAARQELT